MPTSDYSKRIASRTGFETRYVQNVISLLEDGATIPFISRYRKEATGSMDEVAVGAIASTLEDLKTLDHRREYIIQTIEAAGK